MVKSLELTILLIQIRGRSTLSTIVKNRICTDHIPIISLYYSRRPLSHKTTEKRGEDSSRPSSLLHSRRQKEKKNHLRANWRDFTGGKTRTKELSLNLEAHICDMLDPHTCPEGYDYFVNYKFWQNNHQTQAFRSRCTLFSVITSPKVRSKMQSVLYCRLNCTSSSTYNNCAPV